MCIIIFEAKNLMLNKIWKIISQYMYRLCHVTYLEIIKAYMVTYCIVKFLFLWKLTDQEDFICENMCLPRDHFWWTHTFYRKIVEYCQNVYYRTIQYYIHYRNPTPNHIILSIVPYILQLKALSYIKHTCISQLCRQHWVSILLTLFHWTVDTPLSNNTWTAVTEPRVQASCKRPSDVSKISRTSFSLSSPTSFIISSLLS